MIDSVFGRDRAPLAAFSLVARLGFAADSRILAIRVLSLLSGTDHEESRSRRKVGMFPKTGMVLADLIEENPAVCAISFLSGERA